MYKRNIKIANTVNFDQFMASKKAFIVEDITDLVGFLNMLIHKSLISKAKFFMMH